MVPLLPLVGPNPPSSLLLVVTVPAATARRRPAPPPPARLNVSDEEVAARCAERGQQSAVHKALHGRTSLGAIESAYQALVDAYNLLR